MRPWRVRCTAKGGGHTAFEHCAQGVDKALRRGAAQAAAGNVLDAERRFRRERGGIQAGLAEIVDDDRELLVPAALQLVANQRGLSRAEKSRDDVNGDGNLLLLRAAHGSMVAE